MPLALPLTCSQARGRGLVLNAKAFPTRDLWGVPPAVEKLISEPGREGRKKRMVMWREGEGPPGLSENASHRHHAQSGRGG